MDFFGGDLNPGLKRYALTPLKCRELCAADAECELFTVNMRSRRCHFKVRHAPRTLMQRAWEWKGLVRDGKQRDETVVAVSGPAFCPYNREGEEEERSLGSTGNSPNAILSFF